VGTRLEPEERRSIRGEQPTKDGESNTIGQLSIELRLWGLGMENILNIRVWRAEWVAISSNVKHMH
jgi:hypothetical protein